MFKNMKKLVSDALTREKIESSVKAFSEQYCDPSSTVYDIGGVPRYSYKSHFRKYMTVNFDINEKPSVVADAEKLPFRDNSITNIISIALLEHTNKPIAIVTEMNRVMKPGSHALIWVPFYWREHKYPIDNYRYTENGITTLLRRGGFEISHSSIKPYNGFFFVMAHNVRFLIEDPHNIKAYNPLLYIHSLLGHAAKLDKIFKLEYPHSYTGVEVVAEKK